jgi:hypothetical protein
MFKKKVIIKFTRISTQDELRRTERICDILKRYLVKSNINQNWSKEQNLKKEKKK